FQSYTTHLDLHSFPTRRSSDLQTSTCARTSSGSIPSASPGNANVTLVPVPRSDGSLRTGPCATPQAKVCVNTRPVRCDSIVSKGDRKSTRLNSSHVAISYAVFC